MLIHPSAGWQAATSARNKPTRPASTNSRDGLRVSVLSSLCCDERLSAYCTLHKPLAHHCSKYLIVLIRPSFRPTRGDQ